MGGQEGFAAVKRFCGPVVETALVNGLAPANPPADDLAIRITGNGAIRRLTGGVKAVIRSRRTGQVLYILESDYAARMWNAANRLPCMTAPCRLQTEAALVSSTILSINTASSARCCAAILEALIHKILITKCRVGIMQVAGRVRSLEGFLDFLKRHDVDGKSRRGGLRLAAAPGVRHPRGEYLGPGPQGQRW